MGTDAAIALYGLACGTLVAALGLAVWGYVQARPRTIQAAQVDVWLGGVLLAMGTFTAWATHHAVAPAALVGLVAFLAIPFGAARSYQDAKRLSIRLLPALALASAALLEATALEGPSPTGMAPIPAIASGLISGLGAQTLGRALGGVAEPPTETGTGLRILYTLLTLALTGGALGLLLRQGSLRTAVALSGLSIGSWLTWTAAALLPARLGRLQNGMIAAAALLLIWAGLP